MLLFFKHSSLSLGVLLFSLTLWQGMGMGGGDQQKEMQEKQAAMEDMRNSILSQVLTQEARARRKI